jgi:hypothetical protein
MKNGLEAHLQKRRIVAKFAAKWNQIRKYPGNVP